VNNDEAPLALLIAASGCVALRIDGANDVVGVCNRAQLLSWMKLEDFAPGNSVALAQVLEILFDAPVAQRILLQVDALRATSDPTPSQGNLVPARTERLAPRRRCFELDIHPLASEMERQIVLLLSDASERQELALALEEARATRDLALSALRTDAAAMRTLRASGANAVATIRSTLRLPARSQQALQEKLTRMQHEADALGGQAQVLSLTALVLACEALTGTLVALRQKEVLSGDELLPLAPRIDAVAVALGDLQRIDEQRAAAPLPQPVSSIARRSITAAGVPWHEASESRWRTYVHQTGDSLGVLARLKMSGAELVPARYRRHVDAILQPLLDNALQHGIEDLERRLKADKAAAGQITVTFRDTGAEGFEMTVHDDGAGFDVERIGRAAIASGLLTETTLGKRNEASLVGLIFRPTFTTEGLPGNAGRGRGIAAVRRTVTRLGGKIGVATKRRRYTLFTIRLPALAGATAHVLHSARAAP
jgi:two-component system, chemotaxis family, sensor kinase CheA